MELKVMKDTRRIYKEMDPQEHLVDISREKHAEEEDNQKPLLLQVLLPQLV